MLRSSSHKALRAGLVLCLAVLQILLAPLHALPLVAATSCPSLEIDNCPSSVVEGSKVTLTAKSDTEGLELRFEWKVFVDGIERTSEVLEGQGRVSVVIHTAGYTGRYSVELAADGFPAPCPPVRRYCSFQVTPGQNTAYLFETLTSKMSADVQSRRIEEYVNEIEEVEGSKGFAIIYPHGVTGYDEAAEQRQFVIQKVRSARKKRDWEFRTAYGAPRAEGVTELYVVPPGARFPNSIPPDGVAAAPGPAQVNVRWDVLPQSNCRDNFGDSVKKKFYCVEVQLANLSDRAVLISGFYFTSPALGPPRPPVSASGQSTVRATLTRGRETGFRNRTVALVKGFVPVLTGFTAFFRDERKRANYAQLVNIFGGALWLGLEAAFPDRTLAQLEQLDQQTLQNGPLNRALLTPYSSATAFIFIPKDNLGLAKADRDNPLRVKEALGNLSPVGVSFTPAGGATFLNLPP